MHRQICRSVFTEYYTDDIALIEMSQMGMQLMTEQVEKISRRVGLCMNAGKC